MGPEPRGRAEPENNLAHTFATIDMKITNVFARFPQMARRPWARSPAGARGVNKLARPLAKTDKEIHVFLHAFQKKPDGDGSGAPRQGLKTINAPPCQIIFVFWGTIILEASPRLVVQSKHVGPSSIDSACSTIPSGPSTTH